MIVIVLVHLKDRYQPKTFVLRVDGSSYLPSALATLIVEHQLDLTEVSKMEIYPP